MKKVSSNQQGIALVLVLGFLVLISGLVIAFFTSVSNDAVSARVTDSGSQSRQLTDTAVNVVMGQIRQATSRGNDVAWASQPGLIRTFDDTGAPLAYYKLYSAADMEISKTEAKNFDPAADAVSLASGTTNALYTDLNSPANDSAGKKQYPIFDPDAATTVKGFSLPAVNPTSMPVRWQYVLRDGTVSASTDPIGSTGTIATWTSGPAEKYPTKDNPIVGRIAYWTDDETCKVNINTAAGDVSDPTKVGSFWDTPRYTGAAERQNYSDRIPVQNEFQRFPGHPATVYLSTIFPNLTRENIMAIAPRLQDGGTKGGTVDTKTAAQASAASINPSNDQDRLYASVDELTFDKARSANAGLTTSEVERAKFFLTAQSRAPEVNLFNRPRVSMWPIDNRGETYLTAYDKLIRHCTTISGVGYYVKRQNSQSPTDDASLNTDLYTYLDGLTQKSIPGFGGDFQTKYGGTRTQLLVDMLDYIRSTNVSDTFVADAAKRFTTGDQKGQVVPLKMKGKMGFGRFYTLSEAGLIFSNESEVIQTDPKAPATIGTHPGITSPLELPPKGTNKAGDKYIQPAWLMEPFCVAAGYTTIYPDSTWTVEGLDRFGVVDSTGATIPIFPAGPIEQKMAKFDPGFRDLGDGEGAIGDLRSFINQTSPTTYGPYKFLGTPIVIRPPTDPLTDPNFKDEFTLSVDSTKPIIIKIYSGSSTSKVLVQTITLDFPTSQNGAVTNKTITTGKLPAPRFEAALQPLSKRLSQLVAFAGTDAPAETLVSPATATWVSAWDTVRTVGCASGDMRQTAHLTNPAITYFSKSGNFDSPFSGKTTAALSSQKAFRLSHNFGIGNHGSIYGYKSAAYYDTAGRGGYPIPKYPANLPVVSGGATATGDFDNGVALLNDGSYINKPDEGVLSDNSPYFNYFSNYNSISSLEPAFFSPNRIIPSSGMFGSLPTDSAFRTLLFRNQPNHPNFKKEPKDFLFMDLFWMPIVQPYAISEPFSTAGKINLNHQIVPFTNITRTTALEAAMAGEKYLSLPILASGGKPNGTDGYKSYGNSKNSAYDYRHPVDTAFFLSKIKTDVFDKKEIFKSAAQICDYDLADVDWSSTFSLTGDNVRERPYTNLYQKLTTKSNTYMVHYRVQVLKQLAGTRTSATQWATWNEGKDQVLSENRGSSIIERYVDPNQKDDLTTTGKDESLPNFLTNPNASIDDYYRFRIVSTKKFAP